jgi:octaprenyl-diphosphate synthase
MQLPADSDISASVPNNGFRAFRLIDHQLNQVRELIDEQLTALAEANDMNRLLKHLRGRGGKMIRPGLVLLAGGCCGKITDEHVRIAAIIEMIHNATLLHDDVIDEGQMRRGQPTVNSLWGNEAAVLLGDLLLSRVFKMCTGLKQQASKAIAGTAIRVCEGELRQVIQRHNWQLSESEYIDVITEKSAVLFSIACNLGAFIAQATETQKQSLAEFGLNIGIAFQIIDDLLDIIGDESKTGKTSGSDVNKNKLTLAMIHLLAAVNTKEKEEIINSYLETDNSQYDKDALAELLNRYGSLEYAHNRAHEFVATAIRSLADFKDSDAKEALIETARFTVSRTT